LHWRFRERFDALTRTGLSIPNASFDIYNHAFCTKILQQLC
jgi:hypothetical protein